ncbi:hypothetical protein VTO73DRAFT_9161 [Trametes versicolor]
MTTYASTITPRRYIQQLTTLYIPAYDSPRIALRFLHEPNTSYVANYRRPMLRLHPSKGCQKKPSPTRLKQGQVHVTKIFVQSGEPVL